MGIKISKEAIQNYEEYFNNFQFENKFENLKNGKLETDKVHKFPIAIKIEDKVYDLIEKLKELVLENFEINSQIAFFLNLVFKEDVLAVWLSFELLSGAEIVQDKFLYVPRSERFVFDFSKGTSSINQAEEQTDFWNIFNMCFESEKRIYGSLQSIFPDLHFIKPDGYLNNLSIENIVQGKEKQKKEQMLKFQTNVTNQNNNSQNVTTPPKRKLNESTEEVMEEMQKKKKQLISGSFISKSDSDIIDLFKKPEERKEATSDKVTSNQKTNVEYKRTVPAPKELPSYPSVIEKFVALEKANNPLTKGYVFNPNLLTADDIGLQDKFFENYNKEHEIEMNFDPLLSNQELNSTNSVGEGRTEAEIESVFVPTNFEQLYYANENKTQNTKKGRKKKGTETNPNLNSKSQTKTAKKNQKKRKEDSEYDELDDNEDSSMENSDDHTFGSGSDNVEKASNSSGHCDACDDVFYKEKRCVSFQFKTVDYNVCSVCVKANKKKYYNVLEVSKCIKFKDQYKCKNDDHHGTPLLEEGEYLEYKDETVGLVSGQIYRQCLACMAEILNKKKKSK